jgi:hypothetical protein
MFSICQPFFFVGSIAQVRFKKKNKIKNCLPRKITNIYQFHSFFLSFNFDLYYFDCYLFYLRSLFRLFIYIISSFTSCFYIIFDFYSFYCYLFCFFNFLN